MNKKIDIYYKLLFLTFLLIHIGCSQKHSKIEKIVLKYSNLYTTTSFRVYCDDFEKSIIFDTDTLSNEVSCYKLYKNILQLKLAEIDKEPDTRIKLYIYHNTKIDTACVSLFITKFNKHYYETNDQFLELLEKVTKKSIL
jgi:hypothetical protein